MTPTMTIDYAPFSRAVQELHRITGRDAGELIRQQAKLLVMDCIKLTPPNDGINPLQTSLAQHKKVGDQRIRREFKKAFVPVTKVFFARGKGSVREKKLAAAMRKYARGGNITALKTIFRDFGFNADHMVAKLDESLIHQSRDASTGRIKNGLRLWVVNSKSLAPMLKFALKHVGAAKAGWMGAARVLGLKGVPGWISRHRTPGSIANFSDRSPDHSVTVTNGVPYAGHFKAEKITGLALRLRAQNMEKQIERILASGWKRRGFA